MTLCLVAQERVIGRAEAHVLPVGRAAAAAVGFKLASPRAKLLSVDRARLVCRSHQGV